MAVLAVGQQVNIQLRSGEWIRSATILSLLNNTITVSRTTGTQQTLDQHRDIVVIETTSGITLG